MKIPLLVASGDPAMFLFLGGALLLAGAAIAFGVTGMVLLLKKTDEKKQIGKRLLVAMVVALASAAILWVLFTGWD